MNAEHFTEILGVAVVASPALLFAAFALDALLGLRISEKVMGRLTIAASSVGLAGCLAMVVMMLITGKRHCPVVLGNWVKLEHPEFHFQLKFLFDRLSIPFTVLTFTLCGVVGAFTRVYLHREPGYKRFFLFYAMFCLGMVTSALAGAIETLFFGWELVGLSSAFLIAYFHERRRPVMNGFRVWCVYRVADAAFLMAALTLHHLTGAGDFDGLMGSGPWPAGVASIDGRHALAVGLLLLAAAAGKSGLIPFSGWLPRAMEGPTPSSAIFYGALSVHSGAYLLLRVSSVITASTTLAICVVALGLASAAFGHFAARVQADVKSMLAYASLTQVGIIVAEIGLGLRYVALIHIVGHACLRTLQLLRAPSIISDYQGLENAIGRNAQSWLPSVSAAGSDWRDSAFRFAVQRGFFDDVIDEWIVRPITRWLRRCRAAEDRWAAYLEGGEVDAAATASRRPSAVHGTTILPLEAARQREESGGSLKPSSQLSLHEGEGSSSDDQQQPASKGQSA
ncbi:MAG: oxidoreductase [Planctomycetales bacterium]|nr:oxidoreductase [Planctomycetales bacterium]